MILRAATRGSPLALWQTAHVSELLRAADPDIEIETVVVETTADRRLDIPIWEMGGKGVFVKEVQAAVLDGRADLAVHSGKDLPSASHDGLVLAAVPVRGDARDALVGSPLAGLAAGATVATGSARRRAQLSWLRPDLTFTELRGNIGRRLDQVGRDGIVAVVAAAAALERLGLDDRIAEVLEPQDLLPQVAQGALAVECRAADGATQHVLGMIEDPVSRCAVDAERGFLAELGGDCDLPAGAHATVRPGRHVDASGTDRALEVEGLVASLDGHVVMRHRVDGAPADAEILGRAVARHLLESGGAALLDR